MNEKKTNNFTVTDFAHAKVKVAQGWLQGYTEEAPNGTLKIFKGIPYAAPPVGELRFRRPQAPGRGGGQPPAPPKTAAPRAHEPGVGGGKAQLPGGASAAPPNTARPPCST